MERSPTPRRMPPVLLKTSSFLKTWWLLPFVVLRAVIFLNSCGLASSLMNWSRF